MAPRNTILRLALLAGLAVLLSGCHAHGVRYHVADHGSHSHYGGSHQPAHGHGYHKHKHHRHGDHAQQRHHRARAQDSEPGPEGAPRAERRRHARRDSDGQAVRRDRRATAREDDRQGAAAADRGRGTGWIPGPTAGDEGRHPTREGASH